MQYFALDAICELALGEQLGFLKHNSDRYRYLEMNDAFFPVLSVLLTVPWVDRLMRVWPFNLALPRDGDAVGFGMLMGWVVFFFLFVVAGGYKHDCAGTVYYRVRYGLLTHLKTV